jgi:hypothetical protein
MASTIRVVCDKCRQEIMSCPTSLVELRVGNHRARRRVDLCDDCYDQFIEWIDIWSKVAKEAM